MGSLLNTLMCVIHYSWANSRGQVIMLIISTCMYFYDYPTVYKEYILYNIFAINLMQVLILNWSIKNNELVRFLNFYNVSDIIITTARLLFLYGFILVHLFLFVTFSGIRIKNFFIMNLFALVFFGFKLVSYTLDRRTTITIIIFLITSQIAVIFLTNTVIIIAFNIVLVLTMMGLYRLRTKNRLT